MYCEVEGFVPPCLLKGDDVLGELDIGCSGCSSIKVTFEGPPLTRLCEIAVISPHLLAEIENLQSPPFYYCLLHARHCLTLMFLFVEHNRTEGDW